MNLEYVQVVQKFNQVLLELTKKYVPLWAGANPPIGITTLEGFAQNVHPCR